MKYKVMTMSMGKDAIVELKENEIPLNTFFNMTASRWELVCLIPVEEKAEEGKEEETG